MAEAGATPEVSPLRRAFERVASVFTSPLELDHYVELVNPRWTSRELRGRVERVEERTRDAKTIVIRPTHTWRGHRAGQYLRIGFLIDGIWHWRAYSLTSPPDAPDGCISITPKLLESGKVSPYLNQRIEEGTLVRLGDVEGTFVLPDPVPEKILFVSGGSGITPVMSMLRTLEQRDDLGDVMVIHSARDAEDVIFGTELRELADRHEQLHLHEQHTAEQGRLDPAAIQELCPDWRDREAFACGPAEMLDALSEAWEQAGLEEHLHMERFQPVIGGAGGEGEGGTVLFTRSECETECAGDKPILEAGEEAGLELKFGCRMGICHTCTGRLISGQLRDLRSGEVHSEEGQRVRICVNAPEGDVQVEL
jgi:stearoyl-CoA 9-desaturase NADPH oxidoreductase